MNRLAALVALVCAALVAGACGGQIQLDKEDEQTASLKRGAALFNQRCSGCHHLEAANSYGSKPEGELQPGERTNGPNFNVRKVQRDDVVFAIRNGGFSGAIMPANIVVGQDTQDLADFLAKYSGRKKGGKDVMGSGEQGS